MLLIYYLFLEKKKTAKKRYRVLHLVLNSDLLPNFGTNSRSILQWEYTQNIGAVQICPAFSTQKNGILPMLCRQLYIFSLIQIFSFLLSPKQR